MSDIVERLRVDNLLGLPGAGILGACREAADTIESLRQQLAEKEAEIDQLKAMSVSNILIDIVPGEDGMGEEVYAKSVDDVEKLIGRLGEKAEDFDLETIPLRRQRDELHQQLEVMTERYNVRKELADHLSNQLAASQLQNTQLRGALELAVVGSCSCCTKSPDPKFHTEKCRYRIIEEALALPADTSTLEALVKKAGECMRERCTDVIGPYGKTRHLTSYEEGCEDTRAGIDTEIRALPAVKLEDLK